MAEMPNAWTPGHKVALEHVWAEYRTWAATSRRQKREITVNQRRVLALTVVGAVLAMFGGEAGNLAADGGFWATARGVLGILAAAAIALAGYFTREVLSSGRERRWIRARAIAEALKSESYLFRTGTPPYGGSDAPQNLMKRGGELIESADDLRAETLPPQERRAGLPEGPLSVDGYIAERIDDQVDRFYEPRAREYNKLLERSRLATFALGGLAVVLGVLSFWAWTPGWIAVIATVTAAIAAYVNGGRYPYLVVSYQATARKLRHLKSTYLIEPTAPGDFIRSCEEVISTENSAWMAQGLEKAEGERD